MCIFFIPNKALTILLSLHFSITNLDKRQFVSLRDVNSDCVSISDSLKHQDLYNPRKGVYSVLLIDTHTFFLVHAHPTNCPDRRCPEATSSDTEVLADSSGL